MNPVAMCRDAPPSCHGPAVALLSAASILFMALLAAALGGCDGSGGSGGSLDRSVQRSGDTAGPPGARSAASAAPGAADCPAEAPMACADGCCPWGAECAPEGCLVAAPAGSCGAGQLTCEAAPAAPPTLALDASPNGNHALIGQPATFGPGRSGTGLWPGPIGCEPAVIAQARSGATGNSISIEAWFRTTTETGSEAIALMLPRIEGQDLVLIRDGDSISFAGCTAHVEHGDGEWHFVVGTYQTGMARIYLDGVQVCSQVAALLWDWPENGQVVFGSYVPAFGTPTWCSGFRGQIDEIHIRSAAIDEAQVAADFAAPRPSPGPDTVGLWHFDEASANRCCQAGSACEADGSCSGAAPLAATCGGLPSCNGSCCAPSERCGYSSTAGQVACMVDSPPRGDPDKVLCAGGVCEPGDVCAEPVLDLCCPSDFPVGCGGACCIPGASCDAGECACPDGRVACGELCCGWGAVCIEGECLPDCSDPDFPAACGRVCCPGGVSCEDGACGCPSDHPVACGSECCLPGAPCDGTCGCPEGGVVCGDLCCTGGLVCEDGACVDKGPPDPCQCYCNNGQPCEHNSDCPVETPGVPPVCGCPSGC
ncbi:MAG: LamG domain-containing protein [Deltaproteobacteria bacterium]|nr:LamG domain-containing protein [Deltaproteobacteria bacterium]